VLVEALARLGSRATRPAQMHLLNCKLPFQKFLPKPTRKGPCIQLRFEASLVLCLLRI
jgi:hypothetical protein